ncbi:MAG TPA: KipI antagonist, partial [Thermoanaerobaculia bacterium]|nr:KipI antagonist [Thermoanaerobaculia bacterium]
NDRPTTGGYPKVGTIAEFDLSLLARVAPGKSVAFARCTLDEAVELLRERERRMEEWWTGLPL